MTDRRMVCWFSAGAASAVATKLTLADTPDAVVAYTDTGSEHEDNPRFIGDCERWHPANLSTAYRSSALTAMRPSTTSSSLATT